MRKTFLTTSYDFREQPVKLVKIARTGVDKTYLKKQACAEDLFRKLFGDLANIKSPPNHTLLHILAVGDEESFGDNRNNDAFSKADNQKCHHRFKQYGHVFRDHMSDDPKLKTGEVVATAYNDDMARIELLVGLDNDKYRDELEQFETGKDIPFSMGSMQRYDVCSLCGHKAPTPETHCDHVKNHLGEVSQDGVKVYMKNPDPIYYDISTVWKPADRIVYALRKVAGSLPPGHALVPVRPEDRVYSVKTAVLRALASMRKDIPMTVRRLGSVRDLSKGTMQALLRKKAVYGLPAVLYALHKQAAVLSPGDFLELIGSARQVLDVDAAIQKLASAPCEVATFDGAPSVVRLDDVADELYVACAGTAQALRKRAAAYTPTTTTTPELLGNGDLYAQYLLSAGSHPTNLDRPGVLQTLSCAGALQP